jgi:circadian clock protein KaiB
MKIKKTSRKTKGQASRSEAIGKTPAEHPSVKWVLRLYIAGATNRSRLAILRARKFCETKLKGNFILEVIDIHQQPIMARNGQIVVTPTLVREFPQPVRRLIGNLLDTGGLFVELDLDSDLEIAL